MMSEPSNPYKLLDLTDEATHDEIGRAYRARVANVHPDGARSEDERALRERHFIELNSAYRLLRDPVRRAAYDLNRRGIKVRLEDSSLPIRTTSAKSSRLAALSGLALTMFVALWVGINHSALAGATLLVGALAMAAMLGWRRHSVRHGRSS